jgi:hypothetical protein
VHSVLILPQEFTRTQLKESLQPQSITYKSTAVSTGAFVPSPLCVCVCVCVRRRRLEFIILLYVYVLSIFTNIRTVFVNPFSSTHRRDANPLALYELAVAKQRNNARHRSLSHYKPQCVIHQETLRSIVRCVKQAEVAAFTHFLHTHTKFTENIESNSAQNSAPVPFQIFINPLNTKSNLNYV